MPKQAKKNKKQTSADQPSAKAAATSTKQGAFAKLGEQIDAMPQVQAAEQAVAAAREELEKAQQFCDDLKIQAQAQAKDLREKNLGDLVDAGLAAVKKHPAAGVSVAFAAGMFLGRLFRK